MERGSALSLDSVPHDVAIMDASGSAGVGFIYVAPVLYLRSPTLGLFPPALGGLRRAGAASGPWALALPPGL
eukprot:1381886-Alexandrium_andersonii.AAC.1